VKINLVFMLISVFVIFSMGISIDDVNAETEEELAKKLANPIASLISLPFQLNYDENIGPIEKGKVYKLNIQPVIPFSINRNWNLITRTILPVVWQRDVVPNVSDESGLSDTVQSLFFSPKAPTKGGVIWGVGPVFLIPTATDETLGTRKWGAGPTVVALTQKGPLTIGFLANHIWSFAGDDNRDNVNATFMQPFVSYITPTMTTFTLQTETTYNWKNEEWSVPVNAIVSQLLKAGDLPFQVSLGARYWADSPENAGPGDWGGRFALTLLLPKG